MSEKHYPYFGGSFDRIVFDGDGSVWVPEAENAKLREEAESWLRLTWGLELPEYPFNRLRWEELERENAKLRELVRAMWGCISHIGEYDVFYYDMAEDGCGMSCTVNGEHCCADKLHDRMRELGVVDE